MSSPQQQAEIAAEPGQVIAVDENPDNDEENAGNDLEHANQLLVTVEDDKELMQGERGDEEWDRQA